ncbi:MULTISPECIES: MBL fold metallo-hydrolase [unclassified Paenibacillus]|uniref:MBL fold metallo-hydrolase n=1 Tax=unclassified Paenibacillus TaxID=185978 RepID=UPI001AE78D39|nr:MULTISPECIES: MBL fold metallo-hydrolase [unclassified Paenibacillus]MBP1157038.1 glyoxylase-like metal-dependent hydrolase (beta-lactamase superfamily II) [Paenibacillus sp. PvP091]MBP1172223.1 glyoxylase-like metal-dependent hydrolase (beta-lactamase superfamily II) [Paenibacillus sp. PvR098]MBP2438604.1 glyoxylase-like metal-dependent hydrolase (beta-lactamase superfamily II) [Paenibacillus sp. PvP052]
MTTTANLQGMNAKDLTRFVLDKKELFILDVRNESDFNDWKIEGESIEIINIPYFDLLEGVDSALDKIPADKQVLVVCAKEGSSIFVAEQLIGAGRSQVYYLEGGMKSWSEYLEPVKIGDLKDGGSIYQFVRIGKGCLSYMVVSNGEAAIVDTLRMTDVFESFAKENGLTIKHTMDTHLHADHISGGRSLAEKVGATYWLPPKDAADVVFPYEKLEDAKEITVGNTHIKIQPVYSPGHTIGSTSLIVDDQYLLTGDILFIESIGRPDLAGQAEDWVGDLRHTLYNRYKELSNDLIVLPAHFGKISELGEGGKVSARLGDLYQKNPGLNIQDEAEFRRTVTSNLPQHPNSYQEIRQTNMGKIQPTNEEQREMEVGPNRCAIHDK